MLSAFRRVHARNKARRAELAAAPAPSAPRAEAPPVAAAPPAPGRTARR